MRHSWIIQFFLHYRGGFLNSSASVNSLSRVYTRQHVARQHVALPSTYVACCRCPSCCRQQNCCQFVACLLLDTKGYMLPRYRQHVAGNKQHVAWCNRGFAVTKTAWHKNSYHIRAENSLYFTTWAKSGHNYVVDDDNISFTLSVSNNTMKCFGHGRNFF